MVTSRKIYLGNEFPSWVRGSLVSALVLLGACSSDGSTFSSLGQNNLSWFTASETVDQGSISLARDPQVLINGNKTEMSIHNAVELANQKRFVEARYLLAEVRELQNPKEDGYRAVTCAMAILALRDGDIAMFKRTAQQLDSALNEPVNVAPSYVEVISLYRVLVNKNLPVNAPQGMKRLKEQYGSLESAKL